MKNYFFKNFFYFTTLIFFLFFFTGCSYLPSLNKKANLKINNLIDLDRDKKAELIFWNFKKQEISEGTYPYFEVNNISSSLFYSNSVGDIGDIPIFGDFNGDDLFEYGVYSILPFKAKWEVITNTKNGEKMFLPETDSESGDIPIPNDFNGDGIYDQVVYRPKNSGFYGMLSNDKTLEIHFGITGDIPIPKDYDGDGKADIAIYRYQSGDFSYRSSMNGLTKHFTLGGVDFLPIPADYDGDGKADFAAWNFKNNSFKIHFSSLNQIKDEKSFKEFNLIKNLNLFPASSDYDGDGVCELAFWDSKNKNLHSYNFKTSIYKEYSLQASENSYPINFFLLNRFIYKYSAPNNLKILENGLVNLNLWEERDYIVSNSAISDFNGDYIDETINNYQSLTSNLSGSLIVGDFDGDGKSEFGSVNFNSMVFSYNSSAKKYKEEIYFKNNLYGKPFAYDVDLDLMADLIVYNPDSEVFSILSSSNNYALSEVLYNPKK